MNLRHSSKSLNGSVPSTIFNRIVTLRVETFEILANFEFFAKVHYLELTDLRIRESFLRQNSNKVAIRKCLF